jgi:hypothetical protein
MSDEPDDHSARIGRVSVRVKDLEEGMVFLVGSAKFPGGKVNELEVDMVSLRSEVKPEVDRALKTWVASSEFPVLIANHIVTVLQERRSNFVKAMSKPAVQIGIGVITTVLAALVILWLTARVVIK